MKSSELLAAVLLLTAMHLMQTAVSKTCSKLDILHECAPGFIEYSSQGINLTNVFQFYTRNETQLVFTCKTVAQVDSCMENKLQLCTSVNDADNFKVMYFSDSKSLVQDLCYSRRAFREFLEAGKCVGRSNVTAKGLACDVAHHSSRRTRRRTSRHTCKDYEREVLCAEGVVTSHCSHEVAQAFTKVVRAALRVTPHTINCPDPQELKPSVATAVKPHSSMSLSLCLTTLSLIAVHWLLALLS